MSRYREKTALVYLATCLATRKQYVGITLYSKNNRWQRHCAMAAKGTNKTMPFVNAIRKYGPGSFEVIELMRCGSWDEACDLERQAIRDYRTLVPDGYNVTPGGQGLPGPASAHRRAAISKAQKGRTLSPENLAGVRASRVVLQTPEARAKFSAVNRERFIREGGATVAKMAAANRALKGRPLTESQKQARAESGRRRIGTPMPEATKAKLRVALLAYYERKRGDASP
jgi:hypothetical protein